MARDCSAGTSIGEAGVQVDVVWNGQPRDSKHLSGCEEQTVSIQISREAIGTELNELDLLLTTTVEGHRVRILRVEIVG
jgi:hypothetical protein